MNNNLSKFFIFFVALTVVPFMVLHVSAATPFHPFSSSDPSYKYAISLNSFPNAAYVFGKYGSSPLDRVGDEVPISRIIDGVDYSCNVVPFNPSSTVDVNQIIFTSDFSSFFPNYYSDSFTDLDMFILLNVHATSVSPIPLDLKCYLNDIQFQDSFTEDGYDSLLLKTEISTYSFGRDYITYVYHISYSGEPIFFDLSSNRLTQLYFDFHVPYLLDGSLAASNLYVLDFGIVTQRIGRDLTALPPFDPYDPWGDIGTLPSVRYPDSPDYEFTPSDIYSRISELDLIVDLLVPISTVAFSFFLYRIILWK